MLNKKLYIPENFRIFLEQQETDYHKKLLSIALFDQEKTSLWTPEQKKYFAGVFYHLRGHFIDFMWYLANFSPDDKIKKIVMENIMEELGQDNRISHEKLYERFANACGVDIHEEIVEKPHYLPFAQEFNKGHIQWLAQHDTDERLAAFAAYERLDNIDYPYLLNFANSLNLPDQAMVFFRVHVHVEHFESTIDNLIPIWEASCDKVKKAFDFIYSHQYQMWQTLSNQLFSLAPTVEASQSRTEL